MILNVLESEKKSAFETALIQISIITVLDRKMVEGAP